MVPRGLALWELRVSSSSGMEVPVEASGKPRRFLPSTAPLPVPSCLGPLCLWPLPQRSHLLWHAGPRLLPLHLPPSLHGQRLRHR